MPQQLAPPGLLIFRQHIRAILDQSRSSFLRSQSFRACSQPLIDRSYIECGRLNDSLRDLDLWLLTSNRSKQMLGETSGHGSRTFGDTVRIRVTSSVQCITGGITSRGPSSK